MLPNELADFLKTATQIVLFVLLLVYVLICGAISVLLLARSFWRGASEIVNFFIPSRRAVTLDARRQRNLGEGRTYAVVS